MPGLAECARLSMPVPSRLNGPRPENRGRYPKDWKRIVAQIRERSGGTKEATAGQLRSRGGGPHVL
jgi:hypothetical protein